MMKLSRIGSEDQLMAAIKADKSFADFVGSMGNIQTSELPKAIPLAGAVKSLSPSFNPNGGVSFVEDLPSQSLQTSSLAASELVKRQQAAQILRARGYQENTIADLIQKFGAQDIITTHYHKGALNRLDKPGLSIPPNRASGGMIPNTGGIDTVPAMLSGGEFIMNRAAVQNIGQGNLQSMNAGASSMLTEEKSNELNEKLIAKLDELIEVSGSSGDITINVSGSGESSAQQGGADPSAARQQLARQVKDAVMKVIEDEKRLGGQLRRR
jgi:hypothetical protein